MLKFITLTLKGLAMGAANVVPGVSGGTIALITNIYEEFINSLKSFNLESLRLLSRGKFRDLSIQLNLKFIAPILFGMVLSVLLLAQLFDYLLVEYPSETWGYFFGLVLASIYPISKKIVKWKWTTIAMFVIGLGIASALSFLSPSPTENTSYLYIFICGLIGICGMILPGLSGSYILMLMGNYHLLMVKSINSLTEFVEALINCTALSYIDSPQFEYLIYFILFLIGSVVGIVLFSNLISIIFKRFHDQTLSLLTGFVFGSLSIIWPWKKELFNFEVLNRHGEPLLIGYERYIPTVWTKSEFVVLGIMILGVLTITVVELLAKKQS
jgi:putative membrane protein